MRRREREWLDLVADLLVTPLTGWPDEPVVRLLGDTFDAHAGSIYSRSEADPGIGAAAREAVLDAHLAICILKTEV